jgi:tRNA C32,U32 (ribose-2'-O)-methylase TrmJ
MKSWKDNVFFILVEPKEATKRIIKAAKKNQVAILFGREKNRLTNQKDLEAKTMLNLKHLIGRAGLTDWELNMLYGICSQIEKKLKS